MSKKLYRLIAFLVLAACLVSACAPANASPAASIPTTAPLPTASAAVPSPTTASSPLPASTPSETVTTQPSPTATTSGAATGGAVLKVMTHDAFSASDAVIQAFEAQTGATVQFLKSGDAGTATNKAVLSKDNPIADVFYGLDNTFLSRALDEGIFEPYNSPMLASIASEYKLDPQNRALPVDYGEVCMNYDKGYLASHNTPEPQNLDDLLKPAYKDMVVVENPATSSPGLAFLLATVATYGDPSYLDYWKSLAANGLLVVNDWETAYNTEYTRSGGTRPIVLSYNSDPAFEVLNSSTPITEPPSGIIAADNACFRQIEFVGILKGTKNLDLAQKWVDFMLSPTFQEDMPLQMYVFPVNPAAKLNDTFAKYLVTPKLAAFIDPQQIAANRDRWIAAWTATVLR